MRYLLMLAAAASLAACHNRSEDEVGAAPDRGDNSAVAADSTRGTPTDSTMGQRPGDTDTTAVQQDTTGASMGVDSTNGPTSTGNAPTDTTSQTSGGWSDSTSMSNDSTSMSMPSDSTKQ